MATVRRSADEQYKLIMECRSSGLSDYQWCTEHGINPGTFYNWVKRLRKKACYSIPAPTGRTDYLPAAKQDVVKMEIIPDTILEPEVFDHKTSVNPISQTVPAPMTIRLGNASILLQNDVDPKLLEQMLRFIGGMSC